MTNVVPFTRKPTAVEFRDKIHKLSVDSKNLRFDNPHVQQRLRERDITMRQVLETLKHGEVISGPTKDKYDCWRVKLARRVAGRRIQVVVADRGDHLIVVTAII